MPGRIDCLGRAKHAVVRLDELAFAVAVHPDGTFSQRREQVEAFRRQRPQGDVAEQHDAIRRIDVRPQDRLERGQVGVDVREHSDAHVSILPGHYARAMADLTVGYAAMLEQFGPAEAVELTALAEQHGFSGCMAADHFQPWVPAAGAGRRSCGTC